MGYCQVGFEDSRISSSLSPPFASDLWWARVGATVLVSPTPAYSVATRGGTAARVAARVAGLIVFSLRYNAEIPGLPVFATACVRGAAHAFTLNKVSGL